MKKYLTYIAGITFSSIFGFSFLFTKEALEILKPFHLLGFRFGAAALALTLLLLLKIIKLDYSNKKLALLFLLALIQPGLYFIFETLGINLTTSSEAGMMIAIIPIVVTIMASIFLGEKPGLKQLIFVIISVTGVFFIILMRGNSDLGKNFLGIIYLLGAVVMAGIYNILSRKLSLKFKPVEITFIMMWSGAVFFNLIAVLKYNNSLYSYFQPLANIEVVTAVMYLGILSSVLAFFLMNYTLSKIEAARSAVFANLTTIISILAGVLIRGENFYWYQIVGGLLIIIGVWGTNYYGKAEKKVEEIPA
ncbi:MAG: DMT family transporter [Halothermotrichaceae bacterium]